MQMAEQMVGNVVVQSVIGPVVDFAFPEGICPKFMMPSRVTMDDGSVQTFEVEQQSRQQRRAHRLHGQHRRPAPRHAQGVSEGAPITVPVGPATLGRLFNVVGDPIDNKGPVDAEMTTRSTALRPSFAEQAPRPRSSRRASRSST